MGKDDDNVVQIHAATLLLFTHLRYNAYMDLTAAIDTGAFFGKRALVIGGSGGIGAALSLLLAKSGAALTVHGGHSSAKFDALLAQLATASERAMRSAAPCSESQLAPRSGDLQPAAQAGAVTSSSYKTPTPAPTPAPATVSAASRAAGERASCGVDFSSSPCASSLCAPAVPVPLVQEITADGFTALPETPLARAAAESDILCVCYGPFLQQPLAAMTAQQWQAVTLLNYALPGFFVSTALPYMQARGWGRILLFGGTGTESRREFATNAAYAGAKTAVGTLVQSTAAAYARYGITCNALLPGFTQTEYTGAQSATLAQKMPLGTLINAEAAARAAFFLLQNPDINGALLRFDRGWNPLF